MPNFVAPGDFTVIPYAIGNIDKKVNTFTVFVTERQEEMLRKLLGAALYTDFIAGLAQVPIAEKWTKLRDGADYVLNDETYHWDGMKALLKPFIYSEWTKSTFDNDSGAGISVPKVENSERVSPRMRIVKSWNAFVDKAGGPWRRYGSWNYSDTMKNNLYGFLVAGKAVDYPNVIFTPQAKINFFDF